jgi:hypothetical protein
MDGLPLIWLAASPYVHNPDENSKAKKPQQKGRNDHKAKCYVECVYAFGPIDTVKKAGFQSTPYELAVV